MISIIKNASELVTCAGNKHPRAGKDQAEIGLIKDGSVVLSDDVILFAGSESSLTNFIKHNHIKADLEIDAKGKVVLPGFVDSHTHFVFSGSRENEYEMRLAGKSYQEIALEGGGIWSTVMDVRMTNEELLKNLAEERLRKFLQYGTTTIEGKSGYGLDTENELKMLRVLNSLKKSNRYGTDVVPTFLGAHSIPKELTKEDYIELICREIIPEVARNGLAKYLDVFIESGYFSKDDAEKILSEGTKYGLIPRTHIDQFTSAGGTEVSLNYNAASLDHLEVMSDDDIRHLADYNSSAKRSALAGLLPGVSYFLGIPYAPARKLIDAGVPVLIATDFNPGSSMCQNLQMMMSLASTQMKMNAEEIINAVTINPAYSLGLEKTVGSIEAGKQADLLIFDIPSYKYLLYNFGVNNLECVIKKGKLFKVDAISNYN